MAAKSFLPVIILTAAFVVAGCTAKAPDSTSPAASTACDNLKSQKYTLAYPGDVVAFWDTTMGCIAVELYLEKTPITAGNFQNLTKKGFYDGTRFHRVIKNFMNQDGDPNSKDLAKANQWGTGGPGYSIKDEFPCKDGTRIVGSHGNGCATHGGLLFTHSVKGVLSMANSGANSGGSQYFITAAPTPHLDGVHAIFGIVVGGIDVNTAINNTPTSRDRPVTDVVIRSISIQAAPTSSPTTATSSSTD